MKLKYFGTAAAEGIPALFCDCALCRAARKNGGRDIRTRSQALVDGKLLIDLPPDTYQHVLTQGLPLSRIHSCLITHSHSDHLCPAELEMRRQGFATLEDEAPLTFYSSAGSSKDIAAIIALYHLDEQKRVLLSLLEPFRPVMIENYTVTPLPANHDPDIEPFIYLISDGARRMLYGHDTGVFPQETWDYLAREKPFLDFVSLDCTGMNLSGWVNGHMCIDTVKKVRERLIALSCAGGATVWCLQHFSHNGGLTHEELSKIAAAAGFLTAYDGMEISF